MAGDAAVETVAVEAEAAVGTSVTPTPTPTRTPTPSERRPSLPARPPRSPRTRATCPDPNSLYDVMRQNCGLSLFVLPILWTDAHPRLLGAEFAAQAPILTPVPAACRRASPSTVRGGSDGHDDNNDDDDDYDDDDGAAQPQPSMVAAALSHDLTTLLSPADARPFSKSRAIKNVLLTLFPATFSRPKSLAELDLHFGDRVFSSAVRVPLVWMSADTDGASFDSAATRPVPSFGPHAAAAAAADGLSGVASMPSCSSQGGSSPFDGPILAYINRTHLALIRQNLFRIAPGPAHGDRKNGPVSRLQSLRSKQLMPDEPDHDAYFVGVFLAMAQAHFYESAASAHAQHAARGFWLPGSGRRHPGYQPAAAAPFQDVTLRILSHDDETSDFLVYTAVVSAAFLEWFAKPTQAAAGGTVPGMRIAYTRVRVWPVLGLKERLGQALGQDLVGDLVPDAGAGAGAGAGLDGTDDRDGGGGLRVGSGGGGVAFMETWETAESRAKRLATLKRRRGERTTLTDMLSATLEAESSDAAGGGGGGGGVGVPAAALSPHTKRRRTQSLSSSLAVC